MIDLHCHLLPGIDDGPKDMDAALALAAQAVSDGVTHSVLTPHIHHGRWDNSIPGICQAVHSFRSALSDSQIPLTVAFAGEVRVGAEILTMLPRDEIPFLGVWGSKKVMLLEMPHSHILPGTDKIVRWLLRNNVMPLIAHPERNKSVMRNSDNLNFLIELGCLFQVTSGALVGQFGESAKTCAEVLLKKGVVTVLASDAHHVKRRPVNLSCGFEAAKKIVGLKLAQQLVYDNPLKIAGSIFSSASSVALIK
ncbi:capsular biosynthesis protein [Aestuariicella sp. G3-2]|uniref:tyrosine-protein phosphatase n=1 Tax=Pseudomaricurvus albidus TaxID=2842452 RepID=UPI001C0AACDE|nr:CpsB/CapC family capsule biosynthesis tyrosine phosphatase [Aestuariicella albida]MBU3071527.1 capsular biosynthesis protein [Aestuariicella albida]